MRRRSPERFEPLLRLDEFGNMVWHIHFNSHVFAVDNIGYDVVCVVREIVPKISAERFTCANMPDGLVVAIGEMGGAPPSPWIEDEIAHELSKYDDCIRVQFYQPGESVYDLFASRMELGAPEIRFAGFIVFLIPFISSSLS